ncbi:MAG: hypothetical protein Q4C34_07520 [Bacteroidales bacterium]|nr:hypothetical protein [Bacteroidales bacterium]
MKKTELTVDVIYHLVNKLEGLKVCVIESNRNNSTKNKKMLEGCLSEGMQQPGIFADAKLAMDAGYTLKDVEDDNVITADEVDDYLVIVDGNTRFHAYMLSQKDGAKATFEYKFHLMQYVNATAFRTAYQKMNIYNNPTKAEDFARDLMATSNLPVLVSYRAKIKDGLVPKASGFATIGREIVKKDLTDLQKGKTPVGFDDTKSIDRFNMVYDSVKPLMMDNLKNFRGSEVWKFIASKINEADDKDTMASRIMKMFSIMPAPLFSSFQKAVAKGTISKENVVHGILEEALKLV